MQSLKYSLQKDCIINTVHANLELKLGIFFFKLNLLSHSPLDLSLNIISSQLCHLLPSVKFSLVSDKVADRGH